MGTFPQSFNYALNLKGMVLDNMGMCKSPNGSPWSKVSEGQAMSRRHATKRNTRMEGRHGRSGKSRRILMKRRAIFEGSKRPMNRLLRRVSTLKRLVPSAESMGLDGLFREAADYILCLQTRVKIMQIMVKLLTRPDE